MRHKNESPPITNVCLPLAILQLALGLYHGILRPQAIRKQFLILILFFSFQNKDIFTR
jgi:hypothetical protein